MNARIATTLLRTSLMLATVLLPLGACHSRQSRPAPATTAATAEAVGTYHREDLLVAYYASDKFHRQLEVLQQQRDAALAAGDKAGAQALERRGEALQDTAHRQLAGTEPLHNIMADLKDALPRVEQELGVSRLVEDTEELPAGTRVVDATRALTKLLPRSPRVPGNPPARKH
jgi:hypothetical protein